MRFIVSILGIGVGILVLKYRKTIFDWTGHWLWADKYLGGTPNAIILFGLVIIFLSVVYPTGALDKYLGPSTPVSTPSTIENSTSPNQ